MELVWTWLLLLFTTVNLVMLPVLHSVVIRKLQLKPIAVTYGSPYKDFACDDRYDNVRNVFLSIVIYTVINAIAGVLLTFPRSGYDSLWWFSALITLTMSPLLYGVYGLCIWLVKQEIEKEKENRR